MLGSADHDGCLQVFSRIRMSHGTELLASADCDLTIRHHGDFAYVDGHLPDGATLALFRLRYGGSANSWGFAIHLGSRNGYENSVLPSGYPVGTPEEALDCACGLYLNDPTAWTQPPTN